SSLGLFFSIQLKALSYHLRASLVSPSCQRPMARKNQSKPSPPLRSSIDFSNAATAARQPPARYWTTPSVFQWFPSFGASSTAFFAILTARLRSRNFGSGQVAKSQARLFCNQALLGALSMSLL